MLRNFQNKKKEIENNIISSGWQIIFKSKKRAKEWRQAWKPTWASVSTFFYFYYYFFLKFQAEFTRSHEGMWRRRFISCYFNQNIIFSNNMIINNNNKINYIDIHTWIFICKEWLKFEEDRTWIHPIPMGKPLNFQLIKSCDAVILPCLGPYKISTSGSLLTIITP